jgi:hypothetical protein
MANVEGKYLLEWWLNGLKGKGQSIGKFYFFEGRTHLICYTCMSAR